MLILHVHVPWHRYRKNAISAAIQCVVLIESLVLYIKHTNASIMLILFRSIPPYMTT